MKKMLDKKIMYCHTALCMFFLLSLASTSAQQIVPVRLEPRHVPVVQNKYMRVIQAEIEGGDTSLFHVHETPSAFVFLTDVTYDNQVLGEPWKKAVSTKGHAWYSSFENGPSTHRVASPAGTNVHAYDIEILSPYGFSRGGSWKPFSNDTLFVSDKCAGYRIELNSNQPGIQIKERGPMVAIHVSGDAFTVEQDETKQRKTVQNNGYAVIRPDLETRISLGNSQHASIVLFEIR
jgi:hypothetical protein